MSIQILKSNQIPMSNQILMSSLRTTAMKRCVISDETRAAGAVDRDLHSMRRILKRWRLSRFVAQNQTHTPLASSPPQSPPPRPTPSMTTPEAEQVVPRRVVTTPIP